MKKLLAVVGIVLITAMTTVSYMGRTLSQQAFDKQVAELEQLAPLYQLTLKSAALEHSWFGGQATIELQFTLPEAELPPLLLVLESDLQYGPLLITPQGGKLGLASGQSQLSVQGLADETAQQLEALIGPYLMTASHHVNFSQQLQVDAEVPAIALTEQDEQLRFDGIQARIISRLDSWQTEGNLSIGSFQLNSPQGSINTEAAQGRFKYANITDYLAPGRFELDIPQIDLRQPGTQVTLKGLGFSVEQQLDNGRLNISETVTVAEITGPVPVSAASATFEIAQINPQGLALWTDMLSQADPSDPLTGLPDISPQELRELISALLQQGLQFNQRYDIDALDGNLRADLDIEYVGLPNDLHPLDVTNPRQFVQAIRAKLRLEADQQVAMALPIAPALPQYIEQGLVTQQLQKLIVNAELINGELTVNGQPIPLDALLPEEMTQY